MTIIAWRDGVVAADGLATSDDVITSRKAQKIRRMSDGGVAAMMGAAVGAQEILRWIEGGELGEQPKFEGEKSATVVVIGLDGLTVYDEYGKETISEAPYRAFGAGRDLALGAMASGASAEEAVRAACEHSVYCGGEITVLKLNDTAA